MDFGKNNNEPAILTREDEKTDNIEKNTDKEIESKETIFVPETPKFSLDDIILPDRVKDEILDAAEYAENSKQVFEVWGLAKTHKYSNRIGINLYGPSGTGKTMAAHAIAQRLGRKILIVNYADIESKFVGETPKNIRKAFEVASATNSILFFDEADAILSKRVTNMTQAGDVSVNQTRSVMLMLMNEYQDFIIFATNFIENFDPAFMRRISKHVKFELPDLACRKKLWKKYIPPEMPNNVDFGVIAQSYVGLSGSDIATAVLNAAFKAAREKLSFIEKEYFFRAVESILASKEANQGRSRMIIREREVSQEYAMKNLSDNTKGEEQ